MLAQQRRAQVALELGRRDAAEREIAEIAREEAIEGGPPGTPFQELQEQAALLISDVAQRLVGVAPTQVECQRCVRAPAVRGQCGDLLVEVLPAEHEFHRGKPAAVDALEDAALEVGRHALVQPEIVPARVGHQVAGPRVRHLVRDHGDEAAVAGDDGGRDERDARVLHAADRETRRHDEQVVAVPAVGSEQPLRRGEHLLQVGELARRRVEARRFGVHPGARSQGAKPDVADGQRDEVRRDRLGHREAVVAVFGARVGRGTHHGAHALRRADARVVGEADARAVLDRDPAARVNRLGLRVEKRLRAPGGLLGSEPLQRGRVRSRGVLDAHHLHRPGPRRSRHRHPQRAAEQRIRRPELVLERPRMRRRRRATPPRRCRARACRARVAWRPATNPFDGQFGCAAQASSREIDLEVQCSVAQDVLRGVGEGMRIAGRRGAAGQEAREPRSREAHHTRPVHARDTSVSCRPRRPRLHRRGPTSPPSPAPRRRDRPSWRPQAARSGPASQQQRSRRS